jgi:hypothetical protein
MRNWMIVGLSGRGDIGSADHAPGNSVHPKLRLPSKNRRFGCAQARRNHRQRQSE